MLSASFDNILNRGLPLTASLTLRLTELERELWDRNANVLCISTAKYVRMRMTDDITQGKLAIILGRQNERIEYVKLLTALGKTRIASNLNQLAHAVNTGTLIFTPDVVAKIDEAYNAIMYMRSLLLDLSGVRS